MELELPFRPEERLRQKIFVPLANTSEYMLDEWAGGLYTLAKEYTEFRDDLAMGKFYLVSDFGVIIYGDAVPKIQHNDLWWRIASLYTRNPKRVAAALRSYEEKGNYADCVTGPLKAVRLCQVNYCKKDTPEQKAYTKYVVYNWDCVVTPGGKANPALYDTHHLEPTSCNPSFYDSFPTLISPQRYVRIPHTHVASTVFPSFMSCLIASHNYQIKTPYKLTHTSRYLYHVVPTIGD